MRLEKESIYVSAERNNPRRGNLVTQVIDFTLSKTALL